LQVRAIVATRENSVLVLANHPDDATIQDVWQWSEDGLIPIGDGTGVVTAAVGGPTTVVRFTTLDRCGATTKVLGGPTLTSNVEAPLIDPNVTIHHYGDRRLATAVLLPHDHDGSPLPVLLDPYGGPHVQYVLAARSRFALSQWFADQGFAVVVIDGRGTPGRGSEWERAVHLDLATAVLDDQVEALHAAAEEHPLDLDTCGDSRMELRRIPRRSRGDAPTRRVPCRHRRRSGHRLAAVRHALHRAVPR
jgi:dipeptidyl-peptidase-4